jgi:hypothetical protein
MVFQLWFAITLVVATVACVCAVRLHVLIYTLMRACACARTCAFHLCVGLRRHPIAIGKKLRQVPLASWADWADLG